MSGVSSNKDFHAADFVVVKGVSCIPNGTPISVIQDDVAQKLQIKPMEPGIGDTSLSYSRIQGVQFTLDSQMSIKYTSKSGDLKTIMLKSADEAANTEGYTAMLRAKTVGPRVLSKKKIPQELLIISIIGIIIGALYLYHSISALTHVGPEGAEWVGVLMFAMMLSMGCVILAASILMLLGKGLCRAFIAIYAAFAVLSVLGEPSPVAIIHAFLVISLCVYLYRSPRARTFFYRAPRAKIEINF